ncbi:hypothetical protein HPP92_028645 [Vanilla planifolia]|uniref:Uncharacterized protein n=1 Tax=Vanilla planifolia TaxID=51239 RepID=A0A835P7U0_VANPL|nr:hypothetical protein HPP92_028645 [Vanilla planifolia]
MEGRYVLYGVKGKKRVPAMTRDDQEENGGKDPSARHCVFGVVGDDNGYISFV